MKILIVTKNWIGDLLFQLPAIEAISAQYPSAEITCVVPARCKEMLRGNPIIHDVLVFDERNEHKNLFKRLEFIIQLRKQKWEKVFLFHPSKTRALVMMLAGVKERIGFDQKGGHFLTKKIKAPLTPMHQVDYFLNLVESADVTVTTTKYSLSICKDDQEKAVALFEEENIQKRNFVCFHLGANWEPKRWPIENFAELASALFDNSEIQIVVTGAERDQALAQALSKKVSSDRLKIITGKTTLGVLAGVFQNSLCVISGDSGPMHIAAAVGARNVALFGPTDPDLTGPRGIGESVVLSYVPKGYSVPFYDQKFPETGWLGNISATMVLDAIEDKGWLKVES